MSRKSRQDQRLYLYDLGNDRCPICLSSFDRSAVKHGKEVTLEHVPPKGLARNSIAMCLTCAKCNNDAGKGSDLAAISLARQIRSGLDLRVDFPDTPPMTGKWPLDGKISIFGRPGLNPPISSDMTFNIKYSLPKSEYAAVSYLKSAYLSVFSLLGPNGYTYAKSKSLLNIRNQIMNPLENMIGNYAYRSTALDVDINGILMNREQQHWAVKIVDCIVTLPRGGDESFYKRAGALETGNRGAFNGPFWNLIKFGLDHRASSTVKESIDIKAHFGIENLFGIVDEVVDSRGNKREYVVVDHQGSNVSLVELPRD